MELEEKAKNYAEGKDLSALTNVIEQAYLDGYTDGIAAGSACVDTEIIDGVEYVDLKLPSGTKWSSHCLLDSSRKLIRLSYDEAAKLNIPTVEQYEELLRYCKEHGKDANKEMIGVNGNSIKLHAAYNLAGSFLVPSRSSDLVYTFWLKSEETSLNRLCAQGIGNKRTTEMFAGYKLMVMLVHK